MTRQEILAIAKPILFNTEMVRAILGGRKTETRRVAKELDRVDMLACRYVDGDIQEPIGYPVGHTSVTRRAPYQPGDLLYVRETWCERLGDQSKRGKYIYKAHAEPQDEMHQWALDLLNTWRPSIHMPKEAARIFLRVTGVRVELVQDITIDGLQREGFLKDAYISQYTALTADLFAGFRVLWDSTIKPADLPIYGWDANPWIWVIEFERVTPDD